MLGWSFFWLSSILLFPGPSSIWSWDLQNKFGLEDPGGISVCLWVEVGGGDGFHFYWFSLYYLFTPVRVYQFLLLSSSIGFIEYCWLVSDFYFYYCHDSDLFQHDEKFQNDERTMFFDMLPYVCLSDWLPSSSGRWGVAPGYMQDFLSGWWIIRMCQTQPSWELKGAPHNAALPGTSRRYGPLHLRLQLIIMVDPGGGHMVTKRLL